MVEDAAQAHGATFGGRRAGTMGDAGCFSFYPGKNLGAFGDGGAIVTNDAELASKVRAWRSWGATKKYHHELKGGNSRLDALQAAVLTAKLSRLDEWNARRRIVAAKYSELLSGTGDLVLPDMGRSEESVWHLYVVQTSRRDELHAWLNERGVAAGMHYPVPLPLMPAYRELATQAESVPCAVRLASRVLSLPIFPELRERSVVAVCALIATFFREAEGGAEKQPAVASLGEHRPALGVGPSVEEPKA